MIASIAIATGFLAVLDDQDKDFEELFRRAVLLGDRDVLLKSLDTKERMLVSEWVEDSLKASSPEDHAWWERAVEVFLLDLRWIRVPELAHYNHLLKEDSAIPDHGMDDSLVELQAEFHNGLQAEIRIVNSQSGPYVDAILFENGHDVLTLEPFFGNDLDGEYRFEYNDHIYTVWVTK